MDENNSKLFVFDKKEVILIFFFMLLIAVTSFTLGVRVGKGLLLKSEGYTEEDVQTINMKTSKEEEIEDLVKEVKPLPKTEETVLDSYQDRLDQEFQNTVEDNTPSLPENGEAPTTTSEDTEVNKTSENAEFEDVFNAITEVNETGSNNPYAGKWTVQIVSFPDKESAVEFANGFVARGYNPIINSVEISGRGTWYRVSLGLFDAKAEATQYIEQNQTIFGGKEYQIYQIK